MQTPNSIIKSAIPALTRRQFSALALALGLAPWPGRLPAEAEMSGLPAEVAGVRIPTSAIAVRAVRLARRSCPEFLFNHCMRTFIFGALALQKQRLAYDSDEAFVAAALHDLGLMPAYASSSQSFEVDGADAAEKFVRDVGWRAAQADVVWHGVALHDVRLAITRRAGPEALLVALGAGSDVDGVDLDTEVEQKQFAEVIAAFPRLQFKQRFTALLIDHCKRKPLSQRGTWLEGLCREQVPHAFTETVEQDIAAAPFAE
jgi:hypothetical protein